MAKKQTAAGKTDSRETDLPFDEALARLERITLALEEGDLSLDESLARYEEGVRYVRHCHAELENAERRIEILTGVDSDGKPITKPFENASQTLSE